MKPFILATASALLLGCATQHRGPTGAEIMAADPSNSCFKRVTDQFSSGVLANKISFGPPATLEMVLDKNTANAAEKEAISQLSAARQACFEVGRSYRTQNLPGPVALAIDEGSSATTMLMAKLYAGEMTFGQFNIARNENLTAYRTKLNQYDRDASAAAAKANAEDAQRRQAANAALLQSLQTQQAIQAQQYGPVYKPVVPAPLPTTTNCQRFGNQVNCTTY